ncbi:MAG TPA: hypothetical protein VHS09_15420 [Polyangiaceae bacterium]|nr:hypothetical protein [Polyangiaceae bacterium]
MGVLETVARVVELGGGVSLASRVAGMRAAFEARTGAFAPEDPWFEERSRAFWCDAVTTGRFGRAVQAELSDEEAAWLGPLERAHRGLFRAEGTLLVDVWSGAELVVTNVDEGSRAELDAAAGQLFDGRVAGADDPYVVALLPGAVFHPRDATEAIAPVLTAAHARSMATNDALDALLRMGRALRSLSRVKAAYAYRPDALSPHATQAPVLPGRAGRRGAGGR